MSVDTYLKGKNLSKYRLVEHDGLRIHVSPALLTWAQGVWIDAGRSMLFWKRFFVDVQHRHQPT